jgi:ribosomal protein S12 methylthiotransferase
VAARLDVVGVFGYSDEDGTEAAGFDGKLPPDEIADRVSRVTDLVEQLVGQRAEDRVGERVDVLVEEVDAASGTVEGRAAHQGPEVDGSTTVTGAVDAAIGSMVVATVVGSDGADLVAAARVGALVPG